MLGVKVKNVKFKNEYSIQELYEKIKNEKFSAGTPSITKHGLAEIITFPPLNRQNQVWIMKVGFGEKSNKYSVQKSEAAGVGKMAGNMAIDEVTGGLFNMFGLFGKKRKQCEKLGEATAGELEALNL